MITFSLKTLGREILVFRLPRLRRKKTGCFRSELRFHPKRSTGTDNDSHSFIYSRYHKLQEVADRQINPTNSFSNYCDKEKPQCHKHHHQRRKNRTSSAPTLRILSGKCPRGIITTWRLLLLLNQDQISFRRIHKVRSTMLPENLFRTYRTFCSTAGTATKEMGELERRMFILALSTPFLKIREGASLAESKPGICPWHFIL
jgi:hypothetical protein